MELTDAMVEAASREMCRVLGQDPDRMIRLIDVDVKGKRICIAAAVQEEEATATMAAWKWLHEAKVRRVIGAALNATPRDPLSNCPCGGPKRHTNLESLVRILLDNDPDELAADGGITVLDVWRQQAESVLGIVERTKNASTSNAPPVEPVSASFSAS